LLSEHYAPLIAALEKDSSDFDEMRSAFRGFLFGYSSFPLEAKLGKMLQRAFDIGLASQTVAGETGTTPTLNQDLIVRAGGFDTTGDTRETGTPRVALIADGDVSCDAVSPDGGYACEYVAGHEGDHAACVSATDEQGAIPEFRWPAVVGETSETDPWFVLDFCEGAIFDAIAVEDGLDGEAGSRVLTMIRAARTAHGRPNRDYPISEDDAPTHKESLRVAPTTNSVSGSSSLGVGDGLPGVGSESDTEGDLWSFARQCIQLGVDLQCERSPDLGYETWSALLDARARDAALKSPAARRVATLCLQAEATVWWLVGRDVSSTRGVWEFQGIYTDKAVAVALCDDAAWFVAPVRLNELVPEATTEWPGAFRPVQ
jgi:hypothetical protein